MCFIYILLIYMHCFFIPSPLQVQKEMNKNPALKDGFTDAFQVSYMVNVDSYNI